MLKRILHDVFGHPLRDWLRIERYASRCSCGRRFTLADFYGI